MDFSARIKSAWGALTAAPSAAPGAIETKASAAQAVSVSLKVGVAQWSPHEINQLVPRFLTNPIVFAALNLIANATAEIEPYVTLGDVEEKDPANPVLRLLKYPNPEQDRSAFIARLAGFRRLYGEGYVEKVGIGITPRELYAMRPDKMQLIPGPDGFIRTYRFEHAGRRKDWPADVQFGRSDVLHLKTFNPTDDLRGASPLKACARDLDLFDTAVTFQKATLDNGGGPSGVLKYNPQLPPGSAGAGVLSAEQRERLSKMLDERVRGAKNVGRPLLLDGGMDWQQIGMTMVDLQADEQVNAAARRIALALGVPPMLLGIPGDNTYANLQEAWRAFYRQTVIPEARAIYGGLGRWLGAALGMPTLEIRFDPDALWALSAEVGEAWTRVMGASSILTLNEMREALGYEPLDAAIGEQVYRSNFEVPLGVQAELNGYNVEGQALAVEQARLSTELMAANPGYEPSKDRDKDGASHDGDPDQGGTEADPKKPEKERVKT